MAVTYSQDLRDRILAAYDRGMRTSEIARIFDVSPAWARRVKQTRREEGRTTPLPRGGARLIKIDMQRLAELVRAQPDATLLELRDRLGADCSESAMSLAVRRLGFTFKKRRSMPRNRNAQMLPSSVHNGKLSRPSVPVGG